MIFQNCASKEISKEKKVGFFSEKFKGFSRDGDIFYRLKTNPRAQLQMTKFFVSLSDSTLAALFRRLMDDSCRKIDRRFERQFEIQVWQRETDMSIVSPVEENWVKIDKGICFSSVDRIQTVENFRENHVETINRNTIQRRWNKNLYVYIYILEKILFSTIKYW